MEPTSPRAQALAERHAKLIEGFTGGHAAIEKGLGKLWAEQANWPDSFKEQVFHLFAQRGIAAAQGAVPKLLSDKADAEPTGLLARKSPLQWRTARVKRHSYQFETGETI